MKTNLKTRLLAAALLLAALATTSSCKKPVYGCMDPEAVNYNAAATEPGEACTYKGYAIFWLKEDVGVTSVVIGGQAGTITKYYPTGSPGCGSAGCANFTLPEGQYSYQASAAGGAHWAGTVTIGPKKCLGILLK